MRTKEEILKDIENVKRHIKLYKEAGSYAVGKSLEFEEVLDNLPLSQGKEKIKTKVASLSLRVFDTVEGKIAYKTIEVEIPVKTTAKEALEVFMRFLRVRVV